MADQSEMFKKAGAAPELGDAGVRQSASRAILKRVAPEDAAAVRSTSKKLEQEVDANVSPLIDALTGLRDVLADSRPSRGTATRAELARGGNGKMTMVVVGDCSPSMQQNLHSWANGNMRGVEAEDKLFALLGSAANQMSSGQYGDFDTEFMLFSLPERANGVNLTDENGPIPGKARKGGPDNVAKVIKPRSVVFSERAGDLDGVFTFLRDEAYRGSSTLVVPSLQLLAEELKADPAWAERVRTHQEALVVFVVTDGEVFDADQANQLINGTGGLAENGVYVMTAVIGRGSTYMQRATGAHTFEANSPEEFVKNVEAQKAVASAERGGRRFGSRE